MDAVKMIHEADDEVDRGIITLGEYEEKIKPWRDAEPVVYGHWVTYSVSNGRDWDGDAFAVVRRVCSRCGWEYFSAPIVKAYNLCPECGLHMKPNQNLSNVVYM